MKQVENKKRFHRHPFDQTTFDSAVNTWLTTVQYDNVYYQTTLRNLYLLVAGGQFPSVYSL